MASTAPWIARTTKFFPEDFMLHLLPARASSILGLAAIAVASSMPLAAQSSSRGHVGVGLVAGPVQFDMSGTGTTASGALRVDEEVASWLVLEQSLGVMHPEQQYVNQATYIVPELQMQVQETFTRVHPYLGLGVGILKPLSGGDRMMRVGSLSGGALRSATYAMKSTATTATPATIRCFQFMSGARWSIERQCLYRQRASEVGRTDRRAESSSFSRGGSLA
jgi:hypothetical protein